MSCYYALIISRYNSGCKVTKFFGAYQRFPRLFIGKVPDSLVC